MLSRSILMKEAKCNGVVFLAEVQADVGDDRSRYLEIFGDATFLPACKLHRAVSLACNPSA